MTKEKIGFYRKAENDLKSDSCTDVEEVLYGRSMVAYHLERYIGRGGYGEVYECRTEDNNKLVNVVINAFDFLQLPQRK